MKRSEGVSVVAILLIIFSCLNICLSMYNSLAFEARGAEEAERKMNQTFTAMSAQLEDRIRRGVVKPAEADRLHGEFNRYVRRMQEAHHGIREFSTSPAMSLFSWLSNLLSAASLAAGIGLLFLKRWARQITLWSAGVSILLLVGSSSLYPALARVVSAFAVAPPGIPAAWEQGASTMVSVVVRVSFVLGAAWETFLLWFFNRPSVKAQFQRAG